MRKTILAAVLVAVLAPSAEGKGEGFVDGYMALAGLQGVHVIVIPPTPALSETGLTRDTILEKAELVLRRSAIPVLPAVQMGAANQAGTSQCQGEAGRFCCWISHLRLSRV